MIYFTSLFPTKSHPLPVILGSEVFSSWSYVHYLMILAYPSPFVLVVWASLAPSLFLISQWFAFCLEDAFICSLFFLIYSVASLSCASKFPSEVIHTTWVGSILVPIGYILIKTCLRFILSSKKSSYTLKYEFSTLIY